jgi:hypothetical protein
MRTAVCDCVVEFNQKSLAVEDDLGIEYIEPETFADELGRDLYMAFCREMANWKSLPMTASTSSTRSTVQSSRSRSSIRMGWTSRAPSSRSWTTSA